MGWVHCFLVSSSYAAQSSAAFCPVSPDLKGKLGDHQISVVKLPPRSPNASTAAGNRMAFATVATFGANFISPACFQNAANAGGGITPVRISTFSSWYFLICCEKSRAARSTRPGSTSLNPFACSAPGNPNFASEYATPSASLGHNAPTTLFVGTRVHIFVNTEIRSSTPQKK